MKLAHIFTVVLGVHAVIIAAVLVQGCASDGEPTSPTAAAPAGEPERVQEQPYAPATSASRPSSAAPTNAGQTRYPPTRPDWNISGDSTPAVVVPPSTQPVNARPTTEVYVAEDFETQGPIEDSSVAGFNTVRSTRDLPPTTGTQTSFSAPSSAGKTYIVKKGDVLSKVARQHGVTLGEVMELNGFTREEANQLKIGQAILIPASDGEPETPVNTPAPTYTSARIDIDGESYTVQSGDTLSTIATRAQSTVSAIKSANGLTSDRIVVGQKLLVPKVERAPEPVVGVPNAAGEVVYIVKPGDTLGAIANRYGVTVRSIMQANGISDPRRLRAEQKLVIPTGLEPVQSTAPAAPAAPAAPTGNTVRIAPGQPVTPTAPAAPTGSTTVEVEEFSFEDLENAPTVNVPAE